MNKTPVIKTTTTQREQRLETVQTIVKNPDEIQVICSRMERFGGRWMQVQAEALRVADSFRARTLDSTLESFIFEVTGSSSKISAFIDLMGSLGAIEIARTGVSAMSRGSEIDY